MKKSVIVLQILPKFLVENCRVRLLSFLGCVCREGHLSC